MNWTVVIVTALICGTILELCKPKNKIKDEKKEGKEDE